MLYRYYLPLILLITILSVSCHQSGYQPPSKPLFTQLSAEQTGINFTNQVQPSAAFNIFNYHSFYDGGGVAIGDVNNDGWADIFFVSNQNENKLYINKGNWHFEDVTKAAGLSSHRNWSTGVAMADVNGDGLLDIYISNNGLKTGNERANQLFINKGINKNKIPVFADEAAERGLNDQAMTTQAAFFDYDGDGDLDCFMLNNTLNPNGNFGYNQNLRNTIDTVNGQRLYRNDNGHFVNVTANAHIHSSSVGFGLGIVIGDMNKDKWPDIYIANDFFERDYLYLNNRDGTFTDVIDDQIGHISETSMGVDMSDINNDGLPDVFTTDMLPESDYRLKTITRFEDYNVANAKLQNDFHHQFMRNMLQLNNGDSTYSEIGQLAGIEATDWTWGPLIFDWDNDGWKDVFVSNGIYKDITNQDFIDYLSDEDNMKRVAVAGHFDFKEFLDKIPSVPIPNYAFVNQHNLRFKNKAYELGLAMPGFSSGSAYGDLDNDGDLDLVVNNVNMPCFLYRNNTNERLKNNYLRIPLKGDEANTFGIGAEVTAYAQDRQFKLEQNPQRGFESSMDLTMVLGLGNIKQLDSLKIIWPGKEHRMQVLKNLKANQTITLYQKKANQHFIYQPEASKKLYENISLQTIEGNSKHTENNFIDFDRERLMPAMLSTEGPKCAVSDINGDGLDDFFVGGAKGDAGKLFIQSANGKFKRIAEPILEADKKYEDIGAAFFDADKDGDADLMVASGGNEENPGSAMLLPRLYLNDGTGNFSKAGSNSIPPNVSTNASCLRICDFNEDGNIDVFIGGRDVPGKYGIAPKSYLLQNDGKGHFLDITNRLAPGLQEIGMVTDASWVDIDNDRKKDLVIVGEWMPIIIFKNTGTGLQKWKEIPNSSGFWNCLQPADIDSDGDTDFVIGNLGLNSVFKADATHPVQLYVKDFDKNGTIECIPTYYKNDSISYPMYLKGDMTMQMPFLRKEFLKYSDYAGKTINQLFTADQLQGAIVRNAKYLQTAVLINSGNGNFHLQALPVQAQLSPIYGILIKDLDDDDRQDIFLAGNLYSVKPQLSRYDANYGCLLKGDGHNHFTFVSPQKSGLFIKGEVRDVKEIATKKGSYILMARNNEALQLFKKR